MSADGTQTKKRERKKRPFRKDNSNEFAAIR